MIDLIIRPAGFAPVRIQPIHLLSVEEQSSFENMTKRLSQLLTSGEHSEEDVVDSLVEIGLNRMITLILLESVKEGRRTQIKNVINLPPDQLREYVEEAISYLLAGLRHLEVARAVSNLARRHKLMEIRTIINFVVSSFEYIGIGRTNFEKLRDELKNEGITEEQINALLTPMKERFEEIRQSRGETWKSRREMEEYMKRKDQKS